MSLAQLKDQAAHLEAMEQRELLAFLVSLQTGLDQDLKQTLARKIDDDSTNRIKFESQPASLDARQPRPSGLCAGEFVTPADFDDPLPADTLRDFEGA